MCGIAGIYDVRNKYPITEETLKGMAEAIHYRGPDDASYHHDANIGFGFKRLSIIDISNGSQPMFGRDGDVMMICNGEIYNYKELRCRLQSKGYTFRTNCDVEVIIPLYLEYGNDFVQHLNGQFAIALFDRTRHTFILVRDHFGVCPLFYCMIDEVLIFASEIKSILQHPMVKRKVNLTALDQVLTFPGTVSPTTFFEGIMSLKPGHMLIAGGGDAVEKEYWDLDYPTESNFPRARPEAFYIEQIEDLLMRSVKYRLNSDVPVGFYLSGGIDSSLIGAIMRKLNPDMEFKSFSIAFPTIEDKEHDERKYQRLMAKELRSVHNEIPFDWAKVASGLHSAIYHAEGALKESYNTCSLALSKAARDNNVKVILSGEGSDEFFGGYVGYRFDIQRKEIRQEKGLEELLEDQVRERLWGDADFLYERNQLEFDETKRALYSCGVKTEFPQFDSLRHLEINMDRLKGRHHFHMRSYLDLKLRLSDHLVSDHCDRVTYAHSVEGRYPFLDLDLINFLTTIPPEIKLKGLVEKYILKETARKHLPAEILNRQKFSFVAPGSTQLLKGNIEWVNDMLSYDRIKRQGYFDADSVERLKKIYSRDNFRLNLPFDNDLLIIVLTFNIFLEVFDMPCYN
jgi:asparagine synthase (glutamine-hydrolysing)